MGLGKIGILLITVRYSNFAGADRTLENEPASLVSAETLFGFVDLYKPWQWTGCRWVLRLYALRHEKKEDHNS